MQMSGDLWMYWHVRGKIALDEMGQLACLVLGIIESRNHEHHDFNPHLLFVKQAKRVEHGGQFSNALIVVELLGHRLEIDLHRTEDLRKVAHGSRFDETVRYHERTQTGFSCRSGNIKHVLGPNHGLAVRVGDGG